MEYGTEKLTKVMFKSNDIYKDKRPKSNDLKHYQLSLVHCQLYKGVLKNEKNIYPKFNGYFSNHISRM